MANFAGNYKLERNENMDEYFAKVGMPFLIRKAVLMSSPTVSVVKSEDPDFDWIVTISEVLRTVEMKFKFGQEFEENMPMGIWKTTATLESENEIKFQTTTPKGELTRTFTFSDDYLVINLHNTTLDVQGKRHFKRLP